MGTLYIVATPIGNMEDITYRAVRILSEVDLIACEDTRQTRKLVDKYDIGTNLISYHQHSKIGKIDFLIENLKRGDDIALVSDAGTPAISDPGSVLILEAIKNKIKIVTIPGPSAAVSLYSVSGFESGKFLFLGFLPKKKGRKTLFDGISSDEFLDKNNVSLVIYESPHRVIRTLEDFVKIGNWQVVVGREMTKKFEEIIRGSIQEVIKKLAGKKIKGEVSICLSRE